jgi:enediyne biosynthesis protein E4
MNWARLAETSAEESTVPGDRPASRSWRSGFSRHVACLLAFLGLVSVGYVMSSSFHADRDRSARPTIEEPVKATLPVTAETELVSTRQVAGLPQSPSPFRFAEIAHPAGIDFVHFSGMTEERYAPTANGSGVAIFDYDNDGKLDLYFATGTLLPLGSRRSGTNRLYKNLGENHFRDVTEESGLGFAGYCHGIVAGDIDNDGDQDVFLCNYGPNVLFLNNGKGSFKDISKDAGIIGSHWSMSGAFLDYDNDGDLDLYVSNYGLWNLPEDDRFCGKGPVRTYCLPTSIKPAPHILYRNEGNLTFTDVTRVAGLGRTDGRGFGIVAADLNDDGRIDLYVANDMCPNFVFLNRGNGTFEDVTESSGAGYDAQGRTHAGMGVDAEDVDGDGRPDLFVTNYWNEPNSLYMNLGGGMFEDRTPTSGMATDSTPWVGWGCSLADFDNDGWPDCFVANGHVDNNLDLLGHNSPYAQPPLLHRNREGRRFQLATREAGPYFEADHVGRGAAFGDLDDDGDIDIVVNHKDGPPALLRNDTKTSNHWIRLSLVGTISNRDAVGARVEVELMGRTLARQRKGGTSVACSNDPRLLIGLGNQAEARKVTVRWPSGRFSVAEHLAADASYRVVEPRGRDEDAAGVSFEVLRDRRERGPGAPGPASK